MEGIDWARVAHEALFHGVVPLLARTLSAFPAHVPAEIAATLEAHQTQNERRARYLLSQLLALLDTLSDAGVRAIPFKGPALASDAYGDVGLRRAGDLDFLVRDTDLPKALEVMEGVGLHEFHFNESGQRLSPVEHASLQRYHCHYALSRDADGLHVELHWDVAPAAMALDLDTVGWWSRARPRALGDGTALALAPPDLLLLVCVNGSKDEWNELRLVCDVAKVVERFGADLDLHAEIERARRFGAERIVLVGLGLARGLLDVHLPPQVVERLENDRAVAPLVAEISARLLRAEPAGYQWGQVSPLHLRMRERLGDRIRYRLRSATTVTVQQMRYLPFSLPRSLYALYLPVRYGHDIVLLPAWRGLQHLRRARRERLPGSSPSLRARVLVVDWVPHLTQGAGMPRMNRLLNLLVRAGARVTLYPVFPCFEHDELLYSDLPRALEVVRGRGLDRIEEFLDDRARDFDAVVIARPPAMATLDGLLERRPDLLGGARLVYDTEAVFSAREILRRRVLGEQVPDEEAEQLLSAEIGLARAADRVLVTSRDEHALFSGRTDRPVHLLPHIVAPSPGRRPFARRHGLLFVGRLTDAGSPNVDSLVWFGERVLPEISRLLSGRGGDVPISVVGLDGAPELAGDPFPGMTFEGVVDRLQPRYDRARVFIAPTRFAAGVPAKVYDAAAHGLPVVATSLLGGQLGWRNEEELLTADADDPAEFARQVVSLYTDEQLWARVRAGALARVRDECSPVRALRTLAHVIEGEP